jgi:hypothetical protein
MDRKRPQQELEEAERKLDAAKRLGEVGLRPVSFSAPGPNWAGSP